MKEPALTKRMSGTVKWFNVKKGYCFVNCNNTWEGTFNHRTSFMHHDPQRIMPSVSMGETVELHIAVGKKGLKAGNLAGSDGASVQSSPYATDKRNLSWHGGTSSNSPVGLEFEQERRVRGIALYSCRDFMEATTPPCGADPMEATASSFRPEEPSTAAHDSMEATPPPCGVDPIEASAPSCGAASSFRPKEPSTAAHDSMGPTTPPCGADPMEATASSFRPEEPSTAAHDSMEVTPPACSVDPMEASAPSCGAACSFRPEEPSTAAHDPMEATASSFRPEEPSTAAHDSMEATASPCGADSTEATAPSCSSPLDFRPVTPSTWSSSEPVGACTSTPPLRSSAPRPTDIMRRLQAKVSKYRKTIARLRKQEKNMPRSAAEALNIIRPHVTDEKLLTLSPKGNVEEDETDLLQELSPFSLSSESLVDVVQHVPQDDFPSLENITEGHGIWPPDNMAKPLLLLLQILPRMLFFTPATRGADEMPFLHHHLCNVTTGSPLVNFKSTSITSSAARLQKEERHVDCYRGHGIWPPDNMAKPLLLLLQVLCYSA
ncbi:hypothetical protein ISCGN_006519 [Ixodes scapularis]